MAEEIPVYLFTGFLESGKTKFIQEALEGSDFNAGEKTLLLICEEGTEEYRPERFWARKVYLEVLDGEEELDPGKLGALEKKYGAERVIIEYNGMWMLDRLFANMPDNWVIYQEMTFADAGTFMQYNLNMRQLVFDKLKTAEMVVFNRCTRGFDKMPFHKVVRVANRKSQIIYEYGPDDAEPDTIADPLPFDLNAPEIEIREQDYAEWYRDINEGQDKYEGKVLRVKGRCALGGGLSSGEFVFGRHVMTCCVQDIQFAGLLCKWPGASGLEHGGWVDIRARVKNEFSSIYGEVGPVLYCEEVKTAEAAVPEVATF